MKWKKSRRDLPELARLRMEKLAKRGLPEINPESGDPTKEMANYYPPHTPDGVEARPVRLENNQVIWIRASGFFDEEYGYRTLRVYDRFRSSPRSDNAIIAASTVSEATAIEPPEKVWKLIPFFERVGEEVSSERIDDDLEEFLTAIAKLLKAHFEGLNLDDVRPAALDTLEYIIDVFRYYRPGFDDLPREEQIALIEHACGHVNDLLKAVFNLTQFAKYGTPKGKINPEVKNAARDVRAAELKVVTGLRYRKIAEIMGIPPPKTWPSKNDHPTVRRMAGRGMNLLEKAFGKEGMQKWIEEKQEEARWFQSLDRDAQWFEIESSHAAEYYGISFDEARVLIARYVSEKAEALGISFEEAVHLCAERGTLKGLEEELDLE